MATAAAGKDTIEDLLRRFREERDPRALARLFDETAPSLFRIALSVVPDAAAAEEAVQETFLALLEDPARPDLAQPLMPWLVGVLRHKVLDARRRERRAPDPLSLEPRILPADPADEVARRDAVDRVRTALSRLEEPYRTVAMLRWEYGLEPGEIAHARGEPPGTVRSLLSRALVKLRKDLGGGTALAIAIGMRPPQGLTTVRSRVMTHAGFPAAATGILVAGVAVSKTAAALLLAATFVAGGLAGATAGRHLVRRPSALPAPTQVAPATTGKAPSRARVPAPPTVAAAPRPDEASPADIAPADADADASPATGASPERTAEDARRDADRLLDELGDGWIEGWRVGRDLSRLRPADAVLDVLRKRWSGIPSGVGRQNLLKGFSYDSTSGVRLEVFDLGVRDPDPRVQDFALTYVSPYAGRRFFDDLPGYEAWRAATRGRSPESLLDEAAERLVTESRTAPPEARRELVRLLSDVVVKRRTPAVRDAALAAASVWIEDPAWLADPTPILGLIADARPAPAWTAAVYGILRTRGGECARRALLLAGRLGYPPAFDDLVAGLRAEDPATAAAAAVAALEDLTLISAWNGNDAAWWIGWWERNRLRWEAFLPKEDGR